MTMNIGNFNGQDAHVILNSFHRNPGYVVAQRDLLVRRGRSPFVREAVGSNDAEWSVVATAI